MSRLLIKVCGMREPENIRDLAALPVDLVGFIFYPKSPRAVKGNKLEKWLNGKDAVAIKNLKRVGVFVNAGMDEVFNRVHDFELDFVQLHGSESPEYCQELQSIWNISTLRRAEIVKAFPVDEAFDFGQTKAYEPYCRYFLFDTKSPAHGGTGQQFDWSLLQRYQGKTPFLLSGGIDPDSAEGIRNLAHPALAGLDLNSRFELEPGLKDVGKIEQFLSSL